jgi:hypothetical protein
MGGGACAGLYVGAAAGATIAATDERTAAVIVTANGAPDGPDSLRSDSAQQLSAVAWLIATGPLRELD